MNKTVWWARPDGPKGPRCAPNSPPGKFWDTDCNQIVKSGGRRKKRVAPTPTPP